MTTIARQIEALMEDHKAKTNREFQLVERMDAVLLSADMQLEANVRRMISAHTERKGTIVELLNDLHHMMLGNRPYDEAPPVDERWAPPIGKPGVGRLLDEAEQAWRAQGIQ